ncbi:hypothetical protein N0V86_000056 [Didymella sp. IMI 355093]|nr:hypothetical protein N0V86_000056 [Didymella sp. IMI 355093]
MEAQNVETDTALLDVEEKLQIEMLKYQRLSANLKENKEKDTAIAATLAFAMVRGEGTATAQNQDPDDATAGTDSNWWSEEAENVETVARADNKHSVTSPVNSARQTAMAGG